MNWLITLGLSVAGSIILSVLGNLLTDPIKMVLAQTSRASKRKRIKDLQKELDRTTSDYVDRESFYFWLMFSGFLALLLLGLTIFCIIVWLTSSSTFIKSTAYFTRVVPNR